MSDQIDAFRAMNEHRRDEGAERREQAMIDYPLAAGIAALHKLELRQLSATHYHLAGPNWLLNVYPGNCRIAVCNGTPPRFRVPGPWTLGDVVNAAIDAPGGKA
jgi:hypothetical protein